MSAVQTIVEKTTEFLTVNIFKYIEKVSEKAGEKAGDLVDAAKIAASDLADAAKVATYKAGDLVDAAKVATYKIDLYTDKMYLVGTFDGHLKTVADDIATLELLFQQAQPGDTFDDLADRIIHQIENSGDFHTLRAQIIALKDFRDLAMEASLPKSRRLIEYLTKTVSDAQLAVINALRNAFGYAPIVLANLTVDDDDVDPEMENDDVIHNVVAIAFDPFDATNLHNVGISREKLKEEIVKMLKMAYIGWMIASKADENGDLQDQINIVKGRDFLMKQLSIEYTAILTQGPDPGPLLNQIAELMRNANIMTRNTMDLVKEGLDKIFNILVRVQGSEAQKARTVITNQRAQMDHDEIYRGGEYMSQRFKYNRIPPIINALMIYMLSVKGSDPFKRAQEIITEYNLYIEQIHTARSAMFDILQRRRLVPDLSTPGASVQEKMEAYEVFITQTINTYVPTQAFPSLFPERIGEELGEEQGMNMSNNEKGNETYDPGSNEEDQEEQNKNNQALGEINNAIKRSGRIKGGAKTGLGLGGVGLGGGKRKQTRKRSNKKSKKSKKTKRMKKVKRTMKKNKGKKGKKASRKRR